MPTRSEETLCLWLTYPPRTIQRPIIYELGHKFKVVTNIRQASVTDDVGIVSMELEGDPGEIKRALRWLRKIGVKIETVGARVTDAAGKRTGRRRAI